MGTTPAGWRYPEPTDDLRNAAAALRALAEDIFDSVETGSTVVQIELAESPSAAPGAGALVDFNGTQTLLAGFTYAAGVLTYTGGAARMFVIAASVEIECGGTDLASAASAAYLRVNGSNIGSSYDQVASVTSSAGTIQTRRVVHNITVPQILNPGDAVSVLAAATPDGGAGACSLRVYPIGPRVVTP
jgi:hypothetical protein